MSETNIGTELEMILETEGISGSVANNLTTTDEGFVLDARQGPAIVLLLNGKVDIGKIANNLTTTAVGYVLDARQGKALLDEINNRLALTGGNVTGDVNFTNGNAVVFQRPGIDAHCYVTMDGAGNMVMALNKNDSLVNYIELNDVFSYASKPFGISSGGTGAADAATARANLGAVSMRAVSVRVPSSGWATDSNNNMANTVIGISDLYATDNVIVTPHPWHADNIGLYKIRSTANGDGSITFHAFSGETPTMDVYFNALILREG